MADPCVRREGLHQTVARSELIGVGRFRLRPSAPSFADTGPIGRHIMVFPRETVTIQHAGRPAIVADPTQVLFYNRGQEYRRGVVSPAGDDCNYFGLPDGAVEQATREHAPRPAELDRPFGDLSHGPCDARTYLFQRVLQAAAHDPATRDWLFIEEGVFQLLDRVVARAWAVRLPSRRPAASTRTARAHADLADAARHVLARRFAESGLGLAAIAAVLGTSPFHLCRVFRRRVGRSLHDWRTELRLRAAAERILDGADDLTRLALEVGFSSHSHFSTAFRAVFGLAPSRLRAQPAQALRQLLGGQKLAPLAAAR